MIRDEKSQSEDYVSIGTYSVRECRRLLEELEQFGIPFETLVDDSGIREMDVVTASTGGTFGAGTGLEVFVQKVDRESALEIRDKLATKWIV